MKQRLLLGILGGVCITGVLATAALARSGQGVFPLRTPWNASAQRVRPALPLPPRVPLAAGKAQTRPRVRLTPNALDFWQWRGHSCEAGDPYTGDPGWHAWTPYGTDPAGGQWIYSRALFFSSPDLQVWSMVGNGGPWWIQATGTSSLYWWWSGSMWQGPFQANQAFTQSEYGGQNGTNYEAVVTQVWLWDGQWSGPYYNLEKASGSFALLDPGWACSVFLIGI